MPRLGVITVGQSPRNDIMPHMTAQLGPEVEVAEMGALDGFSPDELKAMVPEGDERCLATRLSNGFQVVISHQKVLPLVQERINHLNQMGVDLILLLCTGRFPAFKSSALLIESQKVVDHVLESVLGPERTLGLFVPLPEQARKIADSLNHITPKVEVVSASPYLDTDQFRGAAQEMAECKPDLAVLHCMGYNQIHREIITEILDVPCLVANSMVSRVLAELLGGPAIA